MYCIYFCIETSLNYLFVLSSSVSSAEVDSEVAPVINSLPPGLGKPPPLLPAGSGPPPREQTNPPSGSGDASSGHHMGLQGLFLGHRMKCSAK